MSPMLHALQCVSKAGVFGDVVHYGQHWMYFFFVCGMAY